MSTYIYSGVTESLRQWWKNSADGVTGHRTRPLTNTQKKVQEMMVNPEFVDVCTR